MAPSRAGMFRPGIVAIAVLLATIGPPATVMGADPVIPHVVSPAQETGRAAEDLEQRLREVQTLVEETGALGMYRRDDGQIVVVVPASGRSSFEARDAASVGIDVIVETRDIDWSDIALIKSVVLARDWHPNAKDYQSGALFDARLGKIRLISDAPPEIYEYFADRFPGKTVFEQQKLVLASRKNDVEPHYGGARIIEPGFPDDYCTSSFSVKTTTLKHRMVTAGHCFTLGTSVKSLNGTTFGTVTRNEWPGDGVGNANDMALLGQGTNDIQMAPSIYIGGSTGHQADVLAAADSVAGFTDYCYSGARTFTNCGLARTDADYDMCGLDGRFPNACHYDLEWFEGPAGNGACNHDSGSPFYFDAGSNQVHIRGMVVAAQAEPPFGTIPCEDHWVVIIEKWTKIASGLDVSIKTI